MGRENKETWNGFDAGKWYANESQTPSDDRSLQRRRMPSKESLLKSLGIGEDGRPTQSTPPSVLPSSLVQNRSTTVRSLQSVWLFGGSGLGNDPSLWGEAMQLAEILARRQIKLYFNGASEGMLGMVAEQFYRSGGESIVVTPRDPGGKQTKQTEILVIERSSERRELMLRRPDCYLALPGGVGTFRDLLEVWLWGQMGLHNKPCGVLNSANFYEGLTTLMDRMVSEGFLTEARRGRLLLSQTAAELMDTLEEYCPVKAGHEDSASVQHSIG